MRGKNSRRAPGQPQDWSSNPWGPTVHPARRKMKPALAPIQRINDGCPWLGGTPLRSIHTSSVPPEGRTPPEDAWRAGNNHTRRNKRACAHGSARRCDPLAGAVQAQSSPNINHVTRLQRHIFSREKLFRVHRNGLTVANNKNLLRLPFGIVIRGQQRFCQC